MWGKAFFISLILSRAAIACGVGADLCVCPDLNLRNTTGADTQVCPYTFVALAGQLSELPKLPEALTEIESRAILKERNGKPHVEAAIKVSEARLQNALKLAEAGQAEEAVQSLKLNAALLSYADAHARQLPASEQKERNKCLKEIEQAIFKQQRVLEAARRELSFDYREQTEELVETLKRIRLRALNDLLGGGTIIKQ